MCILFQSMQYTALLHIKEVPIITQNESSNNGLTNFCLLIPMHLLSIDKRNKQLNSYYNCQFYLFSICSFGLLIFSVQVHQMENILEKKNFMTKPRDNPKTNSYVWLYFVKWKSGIFSVLPPTKLLYPYKLKEKCQ